MKLLYIKNCGAFMYSYLSHKNFTNNIDETDAIFLKNPFRRSLEEDQEHIQKYGTRRFIKNHITQRLNGKPPYENYDVSKKEYENAKQVIQEKIILIEELKAESMILLRKKGLKNIWKFTILQEHNVNYKLIDKYKDINKYDYKLYLQAKKKLIKEISNFTTYEKVLVILFRTIDYSRGLPRFIYRTVPKERKILHGVIMTLPHIITTIPFLFFVKSIPLAILYGIILADTIDHGILKRPPQKKGHTLLFYLSIITIFFDPILAAVGFTHLIMDWYGF